MFYLQQQPCCSGLSPRREPGNVCWGGGHRVGTATWLAYGTVGSQPLESGQLGLTPASKSFPLFDLGQITLPL